ncbi:hypothetical protein [Bradyrhizobium canariense]|uniref:Uncharacterized protein n=1 Tax=Bradyrhizobium canariense TaxID=255045 RepID=A0ABX3X9C4_9BRAD|nr:hypothetical protein [Bradyrhizobium canariense]OSI32770.1 hypothetical protein BST65_03670 [Bradyrhizobium canariense]OSI36850.1 hypothetical protein BST66_05265 [Bradyrhizobium canariense]OSI49967.1 hypothetical protein BSZ20_06260 [Bradyrhizobium canariense]OSI55571.1 hypothetical protein BST67_04865 [Bradyrhizobium canariense]OSI58986.1 hypothetical protein BSZ15_07180 [Bradyrhizobium canariense]
MFEQATTALLRAVLDEVCEELPSSETGARTHVACKILEAAKTGERTPDQLRQIGRKALTQAPTMWR